ncbi:hypothetical protein AAFC00_005456 [Neodothiora populina]|uniref:Pyruvate decarboxylase n=1 Tax=Neodothiora populina TaxID=2781224 RepID=A0ABR3PKZ3_9PEZI
MLIETPTPTAAGTVKVVEYIYRRLHEVGVRSVHGVPGDFNLVALDYLSECGLNWVGNVNELNAGYAADGYARINGIAAMMTTFGVGELSATNAIAGAYAEFAPIVHIVGAPHRRAQRSKALLHHTLGTGDFSIFQEMNRHISCAMAILEEPELVAPKIDDVIKQCYLQRRPVYISLPVDMVESVIDASPLSKPIDLNLPANEAKQQTEIVDSILKALSVAKSPVILVDACASRQKLLDEVDNLVQTSSLPTFVSPMGKSSVDESLPNYCGVYAGAASVPATVRDYVESADLVLNIGAMLCDINTAGFSSNLRRDNTIELHSISARVMDRDYLGVHMKWILQELTSRLHEVVLSRSPKIDSVTSAAEEEDSDPSAELSHKWLWPQVGSFLRENDILLTETGTSTFGMWSTSFPKGVTAINQMLWSSIGYSVGAAQGASLAARDTSDKKSRRTILFVGDGSFQLGAQELSTMVRQKLNPIIFVICNNGFTIERMIHGMRAAYNNIQPWNHCNLAIDFGATDEDYSSRRVHTRQDWCDLVADESFVEAEKLRLVEVYLPWDDAPVALRTLAASATKANAKA